MKKVLLLSLLLVIFIQQSIAQQVVITNNQFQVNGCRIYFNGSNNPWESWNDFGGTYNVSTWNQDMINLKNNGINTARIWFSCNGAGQPAISSSGVASVPTAAFWQNCDSLFASAQRNGIYIMATMMSFDHTKNANPNSSNWQQMLNSQANVQTYVNNYIVPFVNRYKTNPYLWSIDICNEIEWIYENGAGGGDGSNWSGSSYPILQRFVAMCAAGIHNNPRADGTTVLATVGSASLKWNGAKSIPETSTGPGTPSTNSTGNKWSDANLKAQYNQSNAVLDFYSPHYYGWMEQYYSSPFENTPAQLGISEKPCVVGEMPAQSPVASDYSGYPTATMSLTTAFNNLLANGWQGHQPWTANITTGLTAEVGDLATFGSYALAFYNSNKTLVRPNCVATCTTPTAPTVTTPVTYCLGATATALSATGTSLLWYTAATGGTGSTTAPIPSTTVAGTTNYYVTQSSGTCESSRALIAVTVNAIPAAPAVTTPVTYCQNATATVLTATGTALKWYTVATGGTGSTTAPTPVTTATGTTNYYVSQTTTGCESPRATIAVTVNAIPAAPTVTTPVTYCQNVTATVLTASGTGLLWYTAATGGTGSGTAPTPSTTATGTTNYYVSQTTSGCESPRATIAVTVNTIAAAPAVTTPVTYCQGATAIALTATGTALKWYTAATGGTSSTTAPTPVITATGTTNYYVSQTTNSCESPRATIAVTVNAIPAAPTVTTPVAYCQNATATVLTSTGTGLLWYTAATGGTGSGTAPTPSTTAIGTTNYYVSQTTSGCESPRATIAVTVNAIPNAPVVTSPVTYCLSATATALTATGTALKWYTVATGGTSSTTAPTPSTTTTGTTNYYVSQTTNGCESPRASIVVTVNASLVPSVTISANNSAICAGTSITFKATPTNGGITPTYQWYKNSALIAGATSSNYTTTTAVNNDSYDVVLTSNATCASPTTATSNAVVIAVTTVVAPTVTISPSVNPVCSGTNVTFTATPGNGGTAPTFQWFLNGNLVGLATTTATYSAVFANGDVVNVTMTSNSSCASPATATSAATTMTVYAPFAVGTIGSAQTICSGNTPSTVNSLALPTGGTTPYTYIWDSSTDGITWTAIGGATGTSYLPSIALTQTTYYRRHDISAAGCGTLTTTPVKVTVNAIPAAPIVKSPVTYCQNSTATALTANGTGLLWYTVSTGGTGSGTAPVPNTSVTGTTNYYVSQTSGTCESARAVIAVTVNALPAPIVTSSSTMPMCTGSQTVLSTGTASTYSWDNGTNQVGTGQTYTATAAGSYTVTVSNGSGCAGTSSALVVSISSTNCYDCANVLNGTASIDNCGVCTGGTTGLTACTTTGTIGSISGTSIVVYPQPFENTTKVELKNGGTIESITIYSSTGSLVYTQTGINRTELEVGESLADGLYNVIIQTQEGTYTTKIVKIK